MVRAIRCHQLNTKTNIIRGSEVSRLSVAIQAVATRYDKLARNYESVVALAFSIMWLPMWVD